MDPIADETTENGVINFGKPERRKNYELIYDDWYNGVFLFMGVIT